MPTITSADALLIAADNLSKAIEGNIPQSNETQEAVKSLQKVFNSKAAEFEIDKKIEYNITPPSKRLFNLPSQRVPSRLPTQRVQSRVPT